MTDAYPLQWPVGVPRTAAHRMARAPFSCTLSAATEHVLNEVRRMGGVLPVISSNLELRRDGLPYANQRQPVDVGAAVYFRRRGRSMVFACDRWDKIEHNLRAIAKTIEALRGIERWGSAEMVDQAFSGFQALPSPAATEDWWTVLGVPRDATAGQIQAAYRTKARDAHPDAGGSDAAMSRLNIARDKGLSA